MAMAMAMAMEKDKEEEKEKEREMEMEAVRLLNSFKYSVEMGAKMSALRRVKEIVLHRAPLLLPQFLPFLLELQADPSSPIRKYLVEMIEELGLEYLEYLPNIVPVLIAFLKDDTPAVARQAVTTGANLFRNTLEQVALQGIYSGQLDKRIEDSWASIVKFKDAVYPIAFQPGADGVRLVAVKFVETTILLFTPDPNVSLQPPPPQQSNYGKSRGFNISWILQGHPILDAGLLGQEASKNLGLLLDQLRLPDVKVLHSSVAIVLINSLSSIAKKRPVLFGRVLPVFLGLAPSCEAVRGAQVTGVQNTLKNAFVGFIKCTNPGAIPWRDHMVGALRAMNAGDLAEQALRQVDKMLRNSENSLCEASSELKPPNQSYYMLTGEAGKKRTLVQETGNQATVDDKQGKRIRYSSPVLQQFQPSCDVINETSPCNGNDPRSLMNGPEMTPVQQLVAMFGAIVAQGDRAVESLEILISRIPTDLLAEVVIANMHNLPLTPPTSDNDDNEQPEGGSQSSLLGTPSQVVPSLNIISQVMALSTSIPQTSMPMMTILQLPKSTAPSEVEVTVSRQLLPDIGFTSRRGPGLIETQHMPFPVGVSLASASVDHTSALPSVSEIGVNSLMITQPLIDSENVIATSNKVQKEVLSNIIPGLNGPGSVDIKMETVERSIVSLSVSMTSTQNIMLTDSNSNDMQEALLSGSSGINKSGPAIPGASVLEPIRSSSSMPIRTMSGVAPTGFPVIPPIINLTEEQQASLSRLAFVRIIEAYRQVSLAGGCELRVALLTQLVDRCGAGYDVRGLLQKHILSDYQNFKGHELTLHVLHQLFGEMVCQKKDTGSSLEVASIYESFLLIVAQTLRDSLPASDKSLSKLLAEVPLLPDAALKILENLCYVGRFDNNGKEALSGDRLTQGLSAVWSLILLRPPARFLCLDIALQTAVHTIEEVRSKAIRLVANKLYPLSYISQNIEEFATKMMLSVADGLHSGDNMDTGEPKNIGREDDNQQDVSNGWPKVSKSGRNIGENSNGNDQPSSAHSVSNVSIIEAQRCMSLYFALCTKKPALLQKVFNMYKNAPKAVKQAVQRHIPLLIRTIVLPGPSSELLRIISNPPTGSESLLMQVLQILTDGVTPSPDLIVTVKTLYETKLKDAAVLIPILSSLTKDEVLPIFPQLVSLPPEKFQAALARILQGSAHTGPALTPAEVLIAIHGIDPERDGIPLKKVTDACTSCFEQRDVFTQQVLAKVLNQLVEQTPLPLLFMRTVIQAIGAFPSLVEFIMEILSRLVSKQIWKFPKLWVGFLKCAYQTKPHSFHVLLQLPAAQLENALNKNSLLRAPLVTHANQPSIRSTLPRSTLVVLGLVQDTQSANSASQNPLSMDAAPSNQIANEIQASESVAGS